MRPDEHKRKKSAQYKKKHAISEKHGEKTKKLSSETLKKTYDDNSVSFPSNLGFYIGGLLPTTGACFILFFHTTYNNTLCYYKWYGKKIMKQAPVLPTQGLAPARKKKIYNRIIFFF